MMVAISLAAFACSFSAHAQDVADPAVPTPLTTEVAADFDRVFADIELQTEDILQFQTRIDTSDGLTAEVLEIRRDRLWTSMFQSSLALAKDIADRRDDGQDVADYGDRIAVLLSSIAPQAIVLIQRSRSRIAFPIESAPADQFVLDDHELFRQVGATDALYRALHAYLEIAGRFELDDTAATDFMTVSLADTAANRSVFMELAINEVDTLRAGVATLPTNTGLLDRLSAAESRVRMTANAMQEIVTIMDLIGLDTRQYRQQILTVTGEITTDVLDVGIMANLISEWGAALFSLIAEKGPTSLFQLLLIVGILFAFVQLSKLVEKGVERALSSGRFQVSHLLRRMIIASARNLVVFLGFLIAISQLGISLGPLLAGLGIAGFIVGFALQDALSNFASGILILLYRPFDVGDVVDAGGVSGKVSHMSLVNTTFMTFDNQKLVVPNNKIWSSVITNLTAQKTRRVDLLFGISYSDDIEKAEAVFHEVVDAYEAVLDDPEPLIKLHELADSSVNFIVRPWVNTDDYWDTYWDLTRQIKLRLDEEGISIPFPQRDVHIVEQPSK